MNRWFRSIAIVLGALLLSGALHAAPPPPPDAATKRPKFQRPPPEAPTYTISPLCTTGPAPQVQVKVQNVYAQLTWSPVPGATSYQVGRSVPARSGTGVALTAAPFVATEYWDAVPDTRDAYQYNVTAVQADGCMGMTTVAVPGPFATPNPRSQMGSHPSPTQIVLTWTEQFGATSYRIDGPGIPNTGLYLNGTTFQPGKKPAMIGVPKQVGINTEYELSTTVAGPGVQFALYTVSAQYPNAGDYSNPGKLWVPRVKPIITGISPSSGTLGQTLVTITGQYLTDPSDDVKPSVSFGVSQSGYTASQPGTAVTPKSVSPTAITAVAPASGYVQLTIYNQPVANFVNRASAVSPTAFVGIQAPPPPPPQVLVPGVVGLSLNGAMQVLRRDGFVPIGASGPAGTNAIVQKQTPAGGARAPQGSTVSLITVAAALGYSEVTLYNNMQQQRSVNVWMLDQTTGAWSGGSAVAFGSTTKLDLKTGHTYFVLVLDPSKCGGQNNVSNGACEYWRLPGVPGDEDGPTTTVPIN